MTERFIRMMLKRKAVAKAALKKEPFAQKPKVKYAQMSDAQRVGKLESLVIALYDAIVDTEAGYSTNLATSCDHERWAYFKNEHEFELSHLGAAAIRAMIRRDKGKCLFCKGDAEECYPRHANGQSCA